MNFDKEPLDVSRTSISKRGHSAGENDDALRFSRGALRFAVADGATESSYSRLWARLVAEAFVRDSAAGARVPDLRLARQRWASTTNGLTLAWYASEKLGRGAFTTLIGLSVGIDGTWSCVAVGDSCLFHADGDGIRSVPVISSESFDSHPELISSKTHQLGNEMLESGRWSRGDTFVLATDAVSAYLVSLCIEQGTHLETALAIRSDRVTRQRQLDMLRRKGLMKDDDLSYMVVTLR